MIQDELLSPGCTRPADAHNLSMLLSWQKLGTGLPAAVYNMMTLFQQGSVRKARGAADQGVSEFLAYKIGIGLQRALQRCVAQEPRAWRHCVRLL